MFRRLVFLVVLSTAAFLVGCGGGGQGVAGRPTTAPVSGTVLYNQEPIEGATVTFVPQGHSHAAVGLTDSSGEFRLQTFSRDDGAVPGEFKVTVRKVELPSGAAEPPPDGEDGPQWEERSLLPERYASAETSGLDATVTEGANSFTFTLAD